MRSFLVVASLLCMSGATYGQAANATPEQIIGRVIETGTSEGQVDKQLSRMGDATAVIVTRLFGDKFVGQRGLSERDITNVLIVLHVAFAAPAIVANVPDREPRTTVFVLQCLALLTNDSGLRNSIAETKQYVLNQFRSSQNKPN